MSDSTESSGRGNSGRFRRLLLVAAAGWVAGCSDAGGDPPVEVEDPAAAEAARRFLAVAAAEDARPRSGPELDLLLAAAEGGDRSLADSLARQVAVRALGRLEEPDHLEVLTGYLSDADPDLRGHAADAVAQALHRGDGSAALDPLLERVGSPAGGAKEEDARVLGVLARSLGRLSVGTDDKLRVRDVLVGMVRDGSEPVPAAQAKGALLGLESLSRAGVPFDDDALARLGELTLYGLLDEAPEPDAGRVRALAVTILDRLDALDPIRLEPALRDPATSVRIAAARAIRRAGENARNELIRRALMDPAVGVRVAGMRAVASGPKDELACVRLFAGAVQERSRPVRLIALEALAEPCPEPDGQLRVLLGAAAEFGPETRDDWQVPARAFVSLATYAPEHAARLFSAFAEHDNELVRVEAVRAARALSDTSFLRRAALRDPGANVRTAALESLAALGALTPELVVAQLALDDPQLLLVASRLLTGMAQDGEAPGDAMADSVVAAFDRISAEGRETWRDPRVGLLDALEALNAARLSPRLTPYLNDYDPAVAQRAAELLDRWNGSDDHVATPEPPVRLPLPTVDELRELERSFVVLHMRRGGVIVIRPLPHLAVTNAHRFAKLTRAGYFDGLTFHRAEPNFVIQGGSPGANEYAGDGPYTRDEVGMLPHWRGTVGLSTRGRDTGDAQIFINLTDNVRLNHDYTIFGIVTAGLEVVDEVVAGDVIERAEVVSADRLRPDPRS